MSSASSQCTALPRRAILSSLDLEEFDMEPMWEDDYDAENYMEDVPHLTADSGSEPAVSMDATPPARPPTTTSPSPTTPPATAPQLPIATGSTAQSEVRVQAQLGLPRRRIKGKQTAPAAYRHVIKRGLKKQLSDAGFFRYKPQDQKTEKALRNRGLKVIHNFIRKEKQDDLRQKYPKDNLKEACRKYWSQIGYEARDTLISEATTSLPPHSKDAVALAHIGPGWRKPRSGCPYATTGGTSRFQSRAILATYHSPKFVLPVDSSWEGLPTCILMDHLEKSKDIKKIIKFLDEDIEALRKDSAADKFSASLEVCIDTYKEQNLCRLHLHAVLERSMRPFDFVDGTRSKYLRLKNLDIRCSHLKGCIDPTNGRKARSSGALHYYLQMPKVGGVKSWTNHHAYKDFLVSPRWINGFLQRGKMTPQDAHKVNIFLLNG